MKPSPVPPPAAQLFVCVNRRPPGDPLGEGCSARGDAVYDAAKRAVAGARAASRVWVTRTYCLGICPKHGATVQRLVPRAGAPSALFTEVVSSDVPALLKDLLAPS